ncbi:ArsR/SmtB family transcription factor [Ewingella sp. S1.OA.A_B6]
MNQFQISVVAHLIAEPVRSVMLIMLSGGEAFSAGALAEAAGVTAQTASFHLGKLRDGGLVSMESVGRYRYFRLAGPHIAHLLESLASVGPVTSPWLTTPSPAAKDLRFARCCYDHLAGQVGVAITQGMLNRRLIMQCADSQYSLTDVGVTWFEEQGIELTERDVEKINNIRGCLDWTERQYHISGPLGAQVMHAFFDRNWIRRLPDTRALKVTSLGWDAFERNFGINYDNDNITLTPIISSMSCGQ